MKKKLVFFDEILDYLRVCSNLLEGWNIVYDEKLEKEIKDLKSIVYYLEGFQDYLIEESGEKL